MRNMLAFLAAAVLVFLGLGWYLDWYSFKNLPTGTPGHQSFNIDINKDKITRDVEKGVQKGEEKVHEVIDKKKAEAVQAEKDYQIAEFYRRTGHPASAYFHYELVRRRYPKTSYSDRATDQMQILRRGA